MFPSSEPYEFSSGLWYSNLNVESITEKVKKEIGILALA
jgi:hypothetical protein